MAGRALMATVNLRDPARTSREEELAAELRRLQDAILDTFCAVFPYRCWVDADHALGQLRDVAGEMEQLKYEAERATRERDHVANEAEEAEERLRNVAQLLEQAAALDGAADAVKDARDILREAGVL